MLESHSYVGPIEYPVYYSKLISDVVRDCMRTLSFSLHCELSTLSALGVTFLLHQRARNFYDGVTKKTG